MDNKYFDMYAFVEELSPWIENQQIGKKGEIKETEKGFVVLKTIELWTAVNFFKNLAVIQDKLTKIKTILKEMGEIRDQEFHMQTFGNKINFKTSCPQCLFDNGNLRMLNLFIIGVKIITGVKNVVIYTDHHKQINIARSPNDQVWNWEEEKGFHFRWTECEEVPVIKDIGPIWCFDPM